MKLEIIDELSLGSFPFFELISLRSVKIIHQERLRCCESEITVQDQHACETYPVKTPSLEINWPPEIFVVQTQTHRTVTNQLNINLDQHSNLFKT